MKILHFIIILLLVSEYKMCNNSQTPSKAKDCNSQSVSATEYRCCFESYIYLTGTEKIERGVKQCVGITKMDYDGIKSYEKYRIEQIERTQGEVDDYEIDCSSKYFYISSISIIMALLFLI